MCVRARTRQNRSNDNRICESFCTAPYAIAPTHCQRTVRRRSWVPLDIPLGHHSRPDPGAHTHVQHPESRRAWPLLGPAQDRGRPPPPPGRGPRTPLSGAGRHRRHPLRLAGRLPRRRPGRAEEPAGRRPGRGDRPAAGQGRRADHGQRAAAPAVPEPTALSPRGGGGGRPVRLPLHRADATGWPASAASGTCPARRSTSSVTSGHPRRAAAGTQEARPARGLPPTRNWSATSAASWPSRRSTARATARSGPGSATRASAPPRSGSGG